MYVFAPKYEKTTFLQIAFRSNYIHVDTTPSNNPKIITVNRIQRGTESTFVKILFKGSVSNT